MRDSGSLLAALNILCIDLELSEHWSFLGWVLLSWIKDQPGRISAVVASIRSNAELRRQLLPPPKGQISQRFESLHQQFVALLLDRWRAARIDESVFSHVSNELLISSFGDPRNTRLSSGWLRVQTLTPESFNQFRNVISRADLDFFFLHAMREESRRDFWLRYQKSLIRTGCVLGRGKRDELRSRASGNPEIVGAAERAHAYRGNHPVAAFYLVFANFVIIEFADTGNAAYLYEAKQFEIIEEDIVSGSIRDPSDLKRDTKKETLNHLANWQVRFGRELRSVGIYAD